jgi:hypothetical protein
MRQLMKALKEGGSREKKTFPTPFMNPFTQGELQEFLPLRI